MDKKNFELLLSVPVIVAALGYFVDIYDLLLQHRKTSQSDLARCRGNRFVSPR